MKLNSLKGLALQILFPQSLENKGLCSVCKTNRVYECIVRNHNNSY